jgi:hypothetical protein
MSCTDRGPAAPLSPTGPRRAEGDAAALLVRISELHYDNGGTDVGERIEVSAPAGTVLDGCTALRFSIGTRTTEQHHVDAAWQLLTRLAGEH